MDAALADLQRPGTTIGMSRIKTRRLTELQLSSHPGLFVGQCVILATLRSSTR